MGPVDAHHTIMLTPKISNEIINAAIEGFESQKQRIDDQIAELRQMLTDGSDSEGTTAPRPGRRRMSAAARKRIGDAQRKRWAATKPALEKKSKVDMAPAKKRKLSPAGRAAIVAALKKRWAAKKRAQEK
jgi:hypothetical protein